MTNQNRPETCRASVVFAISFYPYVFVPLFVSITSPVSENAHRLCVLEPILLSQTIEQLLLHPVNKGVCNNALLPLSKVNIK